MTTAHTLCGKASMQAAPAAANQNIGTHIYGFLGMFSRTNSRYAEYILGLDFADDRSRGGSTVGDRLDLVIDAKVNNTLGSHLEGMQVDAKGLLACITYIRDTQELQRLIIRLRVHKDYNAYAHKN